MKSLSVLNVCPSSVNRTLPIVCGLVFARTLRNGVFEVLITAPSSSAPMSVLLLPFTSVRPVSCGAAAGGGGEVGGGEVGGGEVGGGDVGGGTVPLFTVNVTVTGVPAVPLALAPLNGVTVSVCCPTVGVHE